VADYDRGNKTKRHKHMIKQFILNRVDRFWASDLPGKYAAKATFFIPFSIGFGKNFLANYAQADPLSLLVSAMAAGASTEAGAVVGGGVLGLAGYFGGLAVVSLSGRRRTTANGVVFSCAAAGLVGGLIVGGIAGYKLSESSRPVSTKTIVLPSDARPN
jgi:hypothetical protein